MASAFGSRATLARKLVPRSSMGRRCSLQPKDDTSAGHDKARDADRGTEPMRRSRSARLRDWLDHLAAPRPAGRAQAEYRAEVRTGGLCQAARRPARHDFSRSPAAIAIPVVSGLDFGPRLDGRGDGRRAVRDAGALSEGRLPSDAVAGGQIGAGPGGGAPRSARSRQAPAAADPQRARRRALYRRRHHDRAQSENRKAERLDPSLPAHRAEPARRAGAAASHLHVPPHGRGGGPAARCRDRGRRRSADAARVAGDRADRPRRA